MKGKALSLAFKGAIENASLLKAIVKFISKIVEEVIITIEKDGITIVAMDPSHVAMLIAMLPKEFFSEYVCSIETNQNISTEDFSKVLDRSTSADKITLLQNKESGHDDKVESTLVIKLESKQSKRTFKIKAKDPENLGQFQKDKAMLKALETALEGKFLLRVNMDPTLLDQIVKDSLIVSDIVTISGNREEQNLLFSSVEDAGECETELDLKKKEGLEGEDVGEKKKVQLISFEKKDSTGVEVQSFSSKYSLAFLEDFMQVQGISTNFKVSIGNGIPIKLESEVGWYCSYCGKIVPDGKVESHEKKCETNPENSGEEVKKKVPAKKKGRVIFMIAPRSESSDSGEDDMEGDSEGSKGDDPSGEDGDGDGEDE